MAKPTALVFGFRKSPNNQGALTWTFTRTPTLKRTPQFMASALCGPLGFCFGAIWPTSPKRPARQATRDHATPLFIASQILSLFSEPRGSVKHDFNGPHSKGDGNLQKGPRSQVPHVWQSLRLGMTCENVRILRMLQKPSRSESSKPQPH